MIYQHPAKCYMSEEILLDIRNVGRSPSASLPQSLREGQRGGYRSDDKLLNSHLKPPTTATATYENSPEPHNLVHLGLRRS